jgi:ectoine hydroxylase
MTALGRADHRITAEEYRHFAEQGFLVLPDVLSPRENDVLLAAVGDFEQRVPPNKTSSYYNYADILGLDARFLALLDLPVVLSKVVGILGFNVRINHSHINEDPPSPTDVGFGWHKDGAMASWDMPIRPIPLLGVKVAFYLTDVSETNRGNTYVIPGSHRNETLEVPPSGQPVDGGRAITGRAGTVMLMDPRIIHCRGGNTSDILRKVLFLQFAFRWLQPMDRMRVSDLRDSVKEPVRRQLLGFDEGENAARRVGAWYPEAGDVPLRQWCLDRFGDDVESCVGLATGLPCGWSRAEIPGRVPSRYNHDALEPASALLDSHRPGRP